MTYTNKAFTVSRQQNRAKVDSKENQMTLHIKAFEIKVKRNIYSIFDQSKPSMQFVFLQVFTRLGTVPKLVTPASCDQQVKTTSQRLSMR